MDMKDKATSIAATIVVGALALTVGGLIVAAGWWAISALLGL